MDERKERQKVLVVGSLPDFQQLVGKSLENQFEVLYASSETEGLSKARMERTEVLSFWDISIPGGVPSGSIRNCREGWITKHIPQLVVDVPLPGQPEEAWTSQEAMQMDAEDYLSIEPGDGASVAQSVEALHLTEKIDVKLDEKANLLKEAILNPETFCVTWEQIPGRGAFEMQQETVFDNVAKAAGMKRFRPSASPTTRAETLLSLRRCCVPRSRRRA